MKVPSKLDAGTGSSVLLVESLQVRFGTDTDIGLVVTTTGHPAAVFCEDELASLSRGQQSLEPITGGSGIGILQGNGDAINGKKCQMRNDFCRSANRFSAVVNFISNLVYVL